MTSRPFIRTAGYDPRGVNGDARWNAPDETGRKEHDMRAPRYQPGYTAGTADNRTEARIEERAVRISHRGYDIEAARTISRKVETDPMGPEGVYGFGRCDRCGESFREDDEQAEVAGNVDDPAASILDNLTIHVGCIIDGTDVMA
jgi:hypothetical protein